MSTQTGSISFEATGGFNSYAKQNYATLSQIKGQFATCSTGASTAAKVATIVPADSGWTLYTGATVTVKFTSKNTAATPTLNVNNTGAKQIRDYNGDELTKEAREWLEGSAMALTYDGTYWRIQDSNLMERMYSAETAIEQNANAISLSATKEEVENIQIGGRNLFRNTSTLSYEGNNNTAMILQDTTGWFRWNSGATIERTSDGLKCSLAGNSSSGFVIPLVRENILIPDQKYTISFNYRGTITDTGGIHLLCRSGGNVSLGSFMSFSVSETEWKYYKYTFTCADYGTKTLYALLIPYTIQDGKWLEIKDASAQLELGNKATDWTPAPEDIEAYIDKQISTTKSEIKVTTDGISSEVSKMTSIRYLETGYQYALSNIKTYSTEGYSGTWSTKDRKNAKVGDTVYLQVKDTTRSCYVYIKATVTALSGTNGVTCISHGYEDTIPVDTIKSTINQSSDSVKIQAKHIEIDGTATFKNSDNTTTTLGNYLSSNYDAAGAANNALTDAKSYTDTNAAPKTSAVSRSQRIYYQSNSTTKPATPGTASSNWVTDETGAADKWTLKRMSYSSTKPYIYTCEQKQVVSGTVSYTPVLLDDTTTVIDGGKIITGSIAANRIDADSGTFNTANIPNLNASKINAGDITADRIKTNVVSAINATVNKINAKNIDVSNINIGDLAGEIGGTNLLQKSSTLIAGSDSNGNSNATTDGGYGGAVKQIETTGAWTGPQLKIGQALTRAGVKIGDTVTLSIWLTTNSTTEVTTPALYLYRVSSTGNTVGINGLSTNNTTVKLIKGKWVRLWCTFDVTEYSLTATTARFEFSQATSYKQIWSAPQLEKGNKVTDWQPAPEDVDDAIDDASKVASNYISASSSGIRIASASPSTQKQRIWLTNSRIDFYNASDVSIGAITGDAARFGPASAGHVNIDGNSGITLYDNTNKKRVTIDTTDGISFWNQSGTKVGSFAGNDTTFGLTTATHLFIDSDGGINFYDKNSKRRTLINHDGLHIYNTDGSTEVATFASTATIGTTTTGRITVTATGVGLYNKNNKMKVSIGTGNSIFYGGEGTYPYIELGTTATSAINIRQSATSYTSITSSGLDIYTTVNSAATKIASFGTTATIGATNNAHFIMAADKLQAFSSTNTTQPYFEVSASGLKYGNNLGNTVETTTGAQNKVNTAINTMGNDNKVVNGAFINGVTNWSNWGSPTIRERVQLNGKWWMHCKTTATAYQGYSQNHYTSLGITVEPSTTYTIGITSRGSTASTVVCVGIHWFAPNSTSISSQSWLSFTPGTTAKREYQTVTVPSGIDHFNIMVGQSAATAQEFWITDITMTRGSATQEWSESSALSGIANNNAITAQSTATNAAKTATNYITNIDSNKGITIKPSDSSGNDYLQMNSTDIRFVRNNVDVMNLTDSTFRLGSASGYHTTVNTSGLHIWTGTESTATNEIASFGSTARIGPTNNSRFEINSNNLKAYSGTSSTPYFEVSSSTLKWGSYTAATTTAVTNAAKTASNYFTDITSGTAGVMVHPTSITTTGVRITDSIEILRSNKVMNKMDSEGNYLYDGTGKEIASFTKSGINIGKGRPKSPGVWSANDNVTIDFNGGWSRIGEKNIFGSNSVSVTYLTGINGVSIEYDSGDWTDQTGGTPTKLDSLVGDRTSRLMIGHSKTSSGGVTYSTIDDAANNTGISMEVGDNNYKVGFAMHTATYGKDSTGWFTARKPGISFYTDSRTGNDLTGQSRTGAIGRIYADGFGIAPVSLYDNPSNSFSGAIQLSEDASHFTFIELYCKDNDGRYCYTKAYKPNNKDVTVTQTLSYGGDFYIKSKSYRIAGTSINTTVTTGTYHTGEVNAAGSNSGSNTDVLTIIKVIGYR